MKTEMIAVYVIVVALVAVPYLLMILMGDSTAKKVAKQFKQEAKNNNLKIHIGEHWTTHCIGLDKDAKKLLFVHMDDKFLKTELIDLSTITSSVAEVSKSVNKIDGKKIEHLLLSGLSLTSGNFGKSQFLKFYDASIDAAENFEKQRADKWSGLISTELVQKTYGRVA